jgi:hypothetical protein
MDKIIEYRKFFFLHSVILSTPAVRVRLCVIQKPQQ